MYSITPILIGALLAVAPTAFAQSTPDKPVINPLIHLPLDGMNQLLPPMGVRWVENWDDAHILDWCKQKTQQFGFNPNDVFTFNVHYDDCREPWIMCRHKDSSASKEALIEAWGRLPLSIREHTRHLGVWPSLGGNAAGLASEGNLMIAAGSLSIWLLLHEGGHGFDSGGFKHLGETYSATTRFRDAYRRDRAVAAGNSHNGFHELFADTLPHAIWDRNHPQGLAGSGFPQVDQIRNTVDEIKSAAGDSITPWGKRECNQRLQNGNAVPKNGRRRRGSGGVVELPDTQIRDESITILPAEDYQ